jgi:hypothetical protein
MLFVTCEALGAGLDTITFTRNGITISTDDDRTNITLMVEGCPTESIVNATLHVYNVTQDDAGVYACIANSTAGSDSANFNITVSNVGK